MSPPRALRAVPAVPAWQDVLRAALRPEFMVERYVPEPGQRSLWGEPCEVPGCPHPGPRLARAGARVLCASHRAVWLRAGRPAGVAGWALRAAVDQAPSAHPGFRLAELPEPLGLEFRYALQCFVDEQRVLFTAAFECGVRWARERGLSSLLQLGEADVLAEQRRLGGWIRPARNRVLRLRDQWQGRQVWERDFWPLEELPGGEREPRGGSGAGITFVGIEPAWLREACKRWARRRVLGERSLRSIEHYMHALRRFCEWADAAGRLPERPEQLGRELMEGFHEHLLRRGYASATVAVRMSALNLVLDEIRTLGWLPIPAGARYLRGEAPTHHRQRLPRDIDGRVLAQIEDPANLARIPSETVRTALVLMLDTGLRSGDVLRLPPEPVARGRDGHPYLRFWNHKLRREHTVPLSERALAQIRAQQANLETAWPDGTRYLLPPLRGRRSDRHASYQAVLGAINRWLAACAIRGDDGEPVPITPHQLRHSLATGMLNGGVPQSVVQRWLDHSSPDMTARYARLHDETVREEWRRWQERVNVRGEVVALDSTGPLGEAAWMKDRVGQAKQTLPNGYCGLPLRQTCPHPNACLTCPSFLTDESFRGHLSEQLARTERLIARAQEQGQERMAQMNRTVAENLGRMLATLDRLKTEPA